MTLPPQLEDELRARGFRLERDPDVEYWAILDEHGVVVASGDTPQAAYLEWRADVERQN